MKKSIALAFALFLCGSQTAYAQVAENEKLFKDVMELDSHLFDEAFNQCKLNVLDKYISPDLEFFHDKGGTQNRAQFFEAIKKNICSNPDGKPIRTLVPGSSQVFPLENNGVLYGAVQMGVHRFDTKGADVAVDGCLGFGGGRGGAPEPLKDLGAHPDSGEKVVILKGRYGPYIKYAGKNITLPKEHAPEDFTLAMALPLLPAAGAKSAGKKKAPAKKKA